MLALAMDGAALAGVEVLRAEVLQALDRPDRLEVSLLLDAADLSGEEEKGVAAISRGQFISASLGGAPVFEGKLDRVVWGLDAVSGQHRILVAYAGYHYLRAARPRDRYYQVADSDLARRIAAELELVARVDRTTVVHDCLERAGDPLAFLRQRARESGFHLAVHRGTLLFTRDLPETGDVLSVHGLEGVLSLEVVERKETGRGGRLELSGDGRWRPLSAFELTGAGAAVAGRYRAVRCLHSLSGAGYITTVEFLEDGVDLAAWDAKCSIS